MSQFHKIYITKSSHRDTTEKRLDFPGSDEKHKLNR